MFCVRFLRQNSNFKYNMAEDRANTVRNHEVKKVYDNDNDVDDGYGAK